MESSSAQPRMSQGEPSSAPFLPPLWKRKTSAALVMLPSQARKPSESSQGPIESARQGMGRWQFLAIFRASERASIQLLTRKEQAVRGQTTEKRER